GFDHRGTRRPRDAEIACLPVLARDHRAVIPALVKVDADEQAPLSGEVADPSGSFVAGTQRLYRHHMEPGLEGLHYQRLVARIGDGDHHDTAGGKGAIHLAVEVRPADALIGFERRVSPDPALRQIREALRPPGETEQPPETGASLGSDMDLAEDPSAHQLRNGGTVLVLHDHP